MIKYHILYTTKKGKYRSIHKSFESFYHAEEWLRKIKAQYWEIGIDDKSILNNNIIKIYVAYKSNTLIMPHPICKFHIDSIPLDLYKYGLRYFEDETGWYYKFGKLKCSIE